MNSSFLNRYTSKRSHTRNCLYYSRAMHTIDMAINAHGLYMDENSRSNYHSHKVTQDKCAACLNFKLVRLKYCSADYWAILPSPRKLIIKLKLIVNSDLLWPNSKLFLKLLCVSAMLKQQKVESWIHNVNEADSKIEIHLDFSNLHLLCRDWTATTPSVRVYFAED